jgi:toxin-antitoxin system PIN domain toxin
MSVYLRDTNGLIALSWPTHEAHESVQRWLAKHSNKGWATCSFTQAAFVRIVSNPVFSPDAVTPDEAMTLLSANLQHPAHVFWKGDIPFVDAVKAFRRGIVGHRQVTDAFLLGLAIHNKGRLATLDRGVISLLTATGGNSAYVEVLSASSPQG